MADLLLIVDVQRGFLTDATCAIPAKVAALQDRFDIVIATRFVNPPGSPYRRLIGWSRFAPGTEDVALAFTPRNGVAVVDKTTYSALTEPVRAQLEVHKPDRVILAGIATDNCILKTAVDLFEAGFTPVVLADHVASHGGEAAHQCGLMLIGRFIGSRQLVDLADL